MSTVKFDSHVCVSGTMASICFNAVDSEWTRIFLHTTVLIHGAKNLTKGEIEKIAKENIGPIMEVAKPQSDVDPTMEFEFCMVEHVISVSAGEVSTDGFIQVCAVDFDEIDG
jgi:hypothetical protein